MDLHKEIKYKLINKNTGKSYQGHNRNTDLYDTTSWLKNHATRQGIDDNFIVEYELVPKKIYKVNQDKTLSPLDETGKALYT